jgi:hypothetical protein
MKRQAKEAKVLLAIEVELGRKGRRVSRADLHEKYMLDPYMVRFLNGNVNKTLAEVVADIDSGRAKVLEDKALKQGVKMRETKFRNKQVRDKQVVGAKKK